MYVQIYWEAKHFNLLSQEHMAHTVLSQEMSKQYNRVKEEIQDKTEQAFVHTHVRKIAASLFH